MQVVRELTLNGNELLSTIQKERIVWTVEGGAKTGVKKSVFLINYYF